MSSCGAAFSPSAGSIFTTSSALAPAGGFATGTAVTLLNPASRSSSTTSSTSRPIRSSGIRSVAGPTLISTVTVLSGATSAPWSGSWRIALPTLEPAGPSTLRKAGCRSASISACSAPCRVLPSTDGTVTLLDGPPSSSRYAPKANPPSTSRVRTATSTVRPTGGRRASVGSSARPTRAVVAVSGGPATVAPSAGGGSPPAAAGRTGPRRPCVASSSTSVTGDGTGTAPTMWVSWSCSAGTAACGGSPARTRLMSVAISSADWYRSAGSLASAFATTASTSVPIDGFTSLGGTGGSRTCWYATLTEESPRKGGRPSSSS